MPTFNADLADFANYVKVGSEVTLTTKDAVAANSTVTLNYTVGSKADKQDKSTGKDAAKLSFTIKADAGRGADWVRLRLPCTR